MKQADVTHKGRYVATIEKQKTVVIAYRNGKGWSFRNEATGRFVKCSTRGLYRPVMDWERFDDETVTIPSATRHRACWDGQIGSVPVVKIFPAKIPADFPDEKIPAEQKTDPLDNITNYMYELAITESRSNLALA